MPKITRKGMFREHIPVKDPPASPVWRPYDDGSQLFCEWTTKCVCNSSINAHERAVEDASQSNLFGESKWHVCITYRGQQASRPTSRAASAPAETAGGATPPRLSWAAVATAVAIATMAMAMVTAMTADVQLLVRGVQGCRALGGVMILAPSFGFCALRTLHYSRPWVLFHLQTESARCRAEAVCARPR